MRVVRKLPEEMWREFVEAHADGNIFHTPEMFQVFSAVPGYQPECWAAVVGERICALMLPVRITVREGMLERLTSRAVVFNGFLSSPDDTGRHGVDLLLRMYKRKTGRSVLFTRIYSTAQADHAKPTLEQHGFSLEATEKYIVPLAQPAEQLFKKVHKRVRNYVRRGEKRGDVTIEAVMDKIQLQEAYGLLCRSAQDKQFDMADFALFESLFDILQPKGMLKCTLARVGQAPAAASVDLLYKDVVFGWYGGMDRTYHADRSNELLMWHILKWGAENGYRLYDFGGTGIQDDGEDLSRFKARFGSTPVPFGRYTYEHIPFAVSLGAWGYGVYQNLRDVAAKTRLKDAA